jgi:hypothetical protein
MRTRLEGATTYAPGPLDAIPILLVGLPTSHERGVIAGLEATPGVEVCAVAPTWGHVDEAMLRAAAVVVVPLQQPGVMPDDCWHAVSTHAHLRVLGLTAEGDAWLFELEPRAWSIGPVAPESVAKIVSVRVE